MKRFFALTVTLILIFSVMPSASAASPARPDWLITEICADTKGFSASQSGYTTGSDCGEFIEIYNNSGHELDLYEYCVTYNGNERDHSYFCKQITEITPIKAGDYRDETASKAKQLMTNPATCIVQPGECVVLWSVYKDAVDNNMTEAKFRSHWGITDDIKVIAFDGNGSAHSKNFNIKNSGVGTYGIAKYDSTLQSKKNSVIDTPSGYDAYSAMISYAVFDYSDVGASKANHTANFTYPTSGKAMTYSSYTAYMATTPGYLNEAQMMSVDSAQISASNVVEGDETTTALIKANALPMPINGQAVAVVEQVRDTDESDKGCTSAVLLPTALFAALGMAICFKKH